MYTRIMIPVDLAHVDKLGKALKSWTFAKGAEDWGGAANHCSAISAKDGGLRVEYDGNDPYFESAACNFEGH